MQNQKKLSFEDTAIYIGINVHKKSWTVSIYLEEFEHKTFSQPPEPVVLKNYLHAHFPKGVYYAVYEAGYSGFWIYDVFTGNGSEVHHCSSFRCSYYRFRTTPQE